MKLTLNLDLPEPLFNELRTAAQYCAITPSAFAEQTIEAALATRRLPRIEAGRCGARFTTAQDGDE